MRPMIGVSPLVDIKRESLWMFPGYFDLVKQAGGLPVMLPLTEDDGTIRQIVSTFDGFLFTGGQDVSPELYHEKPLRATLEVCPKRDRMELKLLKLAMEADKPILGICRGIQFINVALGGTLYQDLPLQHKSIINHHQSPPYDKPAHKVTLLPSTPLIDLLKEKTIAVNSYHHQAIKDLAKSLSVMAISEDGLIEAVYNTECNYLWAVQWHPEYSYEIDITSIQIFKAFICACTLLPTYRKRFCTTVGL